MESVGESRVTLEGFDLFFVIGTEEQVKLYRQLSARIAEKIDKGESLSPEEEELCQMEGQLMAADAAAAAGGAIFGAVITKEGLQIDRRDNWDWNSAMKREDLFLTSHNTGYTEN